MNNYSNESNQLQIKSLSQPIKAHIQMVPSKSCTHRAFVMAALADGSSDIINPLLSEDTLLTLEALMNMGIQVNETSYGVLIHGKAGELLTSDKQFTLNNSGTSLRLLTSIASLGVGKPTITGNERLCQRPLKDLIDALRGLGVTINYLGAEGYPPIQILSKLIGGTTTIKGDISSQFISSLLISSPYAVKDVEIIPSSLLTSKPYIDLTIEIMAKFGVLVTDDNHRFKILANQIYKPTTFKVEGDFSSASYFFAAAAIMGGIIRISGLNSKSKQADRIFLDFMTLMGCEITSNNDTIELIRDPRNHLVGIDVDLGNSPDIVPTLAIVASFASSPTVIRNIAHLRHKESNRIETTANELRKIGAIVKTTEHSMAIFPSGNKRGALIETYNDHRIAMAFSIAGLKVPGMIISNPGCVIKSFPLFFQTLEKIYPQGAET